MLLVALCLGNGISSGWGANRLECRLNLAVSSPSFLIPSVRLHTLVSGQANSDS